MSNAAIAELDQLISKLEGELAADPRFTLLNNLKAARAAYPSSSNPNSAREYDVESPTTRMPVEEGGPTLAPARAKAFKLCRDYLQGKAEPIRTRQLYELIEDAGIDLPGGMNNLSALLGRHPKVFRSHGRQGWTLKNSNFANAEAAGDLLSGSAPTASISSPPDQRTNLQ